MKEFALSERDRAHVALKSSERLIDLDPDSAASRAYYAAFHAVTALFAIKGQDFAKHASLRAALHKDLIKTGKRPIELGRDFDLLMDLRETGDYGGMSHVSSEAARNALACAERIIKAVEKECPELSK